MSGSVKEIDIKPAVIKMEEVLQHDITGHKTVAKITMWVTHVKGCSNIQPIIKNESVFQQFKKYEIRFKL